jgi:hypothetical protein
MGLVSRHRPAGAEFRPLVFESPSFLHSTCGWPTFAPSFSILLSAAAGPANAFWSGLGHRAISEQLAAGGEARVLSVQGYVVKCEEDEALLRATWK